MSNLEKTVEVKTFIGEEEYKDKVNLSGFTKKEEGLVNEYIKMLKELTRAVLKKTGSQQITISMTYYLPEENYQ